LSNLPRIEKLQRSHNVEPFDWGQVALNRFLVRHALHNQQSNAATTYVALVEQEVIGFYSLAFGQIEYADAPERVTKGSARHPVPVMLLARLAVSLAWLGKRFGAGMLKDAMLRTLQAPKLRVSELLPPTRRTITRARSMSASISNHHPLTRIIWPCCLRMCEPVCRYEPMTGRQVALSGLGKHTPSRCYTNLTNV
jgi:hypothetical protein